MGWIACSDAPRQPKGGDSLGVHGQALTPSGGEPILDFDQNAGANEIALTFDDGPDDTNCSKVLDALKNAGVHATFFINTNNYATVSSDSTAQAVIKRMYNEGHHVGNHTVHHYDLNDTSVNVTSEIDGVYQAMKTYIPGALQNRLFRAPYGNPYFGPQDRLDYVAPIVAKYGVHIGWNIDSGDSSGCSSSSCVTNTVLNAVDSGQTGIVLMHCVDSWTASAVPGLISSLKSRGMKFIYVEDLVVRKYGQPSRDLITCTSDSVCVSGETCQNGHCAPSSGGTDAGTDTAPADTGSADTTPADTGSDTTVTDTGTSDTSVGDSSYSPITVLCSSLTVEKGSVGNASAACSGTPPALSQADGAEIWWNPPGSATSAYATYQVPAVSVGTMQLTVRFLGDDKTEALWYWWVQRADGTGWDVVGDNSWAGNWVWTNHTFSIATPAKYIDATGKVRIRFGTNTSTNSAELDRMVLVVGP